MGELTFAPGHFVWRELMTTDAAKATKFYGDLFGWTYRPVEIGPGMTYHLASSGSREIAGMMAAPPGVPSHWGSLVSVPDVDAAAAKVTELGGKLLMEPHTMPNVGRFAACADFAGAVFTLFKSANGDLDPSQRPPPSTFCWETLSADDVARAKSFYSAVVGWTVADAPPGAGGAVFRAADGATVADLQSARPGVPPHWLTYVVVERLETARTRAEQLGATFPVPLVEIPSIGRIALMADPTGAHIGLFETAPG